MKRYMGALATAFALLATACGGSSTGVATTEPATTTQVTATTTPPTTTTLPPTTTTSTTTTTTLPPTTTTTTTLPPAPVDGWEGAGPQAIAVDLVFDLEGADAPLRSLVVDALKAMGLDVNGAADTTITLDLTGTAKGGSYGSAGYCYTGGRVRGDIVLSAPDRPDLRFEVDGDYPAPFGVSTASCSKRRNPEDAPFTYAFEPEFKDALIEWWGPASIPYLADILKDDLYLNRIRIETIQAVRLMTWDQVSPEYQYLILDAALWFCGRTTYQSHEGEIVRYREAVTRLFAETLDLDVEVLDDAGVRAAQRALDRTYGK